MCQGILECEVLVGTRSAEGIMASGHVNRIKRPNTWLHRPMLQNREESSCQTGAVHTWHFSDVTAGLRNVCCWGKSGSRDCVARLPSRTLSGNERGARQRLGALACFIVALQFLSQRRDDAMDCFYQGRCTSCK